MDIAAVIIIAVVAFVCAIALGGWRRALRNARLREAVLCADMALTEETAQTGYWTEDFDKDSCTWSPGLYRIFGLDPANFRPTRPTVLTFFVPEHQAKVIRELTAIRKSVGQGRIDTRIRRADGTIRDVELNVRCRKTGDEVALFGVITDVTQLRNAERLIAEREDQVQRAVSASRAAIWDWDLESNSLYVSSRFGEMIGLPTDSWAPSRALHDSLCHPDDLPRIAAALAEYIAQGTPFEIEYRLRHADGHEVWVQSKGRGIASRDGKLIRMMGSLLDVTQRREMDAALAEKQDMLELAVETAQAGHFEYRLDTGELYWSPRLRLMLGISQERPAATDYIREHIYPDDLPEFLVARETFQRTSQPLDVEVRVRHALGHYIWLHIREMFQFDSNGRRRRNIGFVLEVSARREAQRALGDSERKFRNLIEGSIQGVIIHRKSRPLFCNAAYARLLGYETAEALLALPSLAPHFVVDTPEEMEDIWDRAISGQLDGKVIRQKILHRSGKEIWLDTVGRVIQWEGEAAWQNAVIDVTEQKRVEDELRASEERFRFLADNANDIITLYDQDGKILYSSPSVFRISGFSVEQSSGRSLFGIVHPDDMEHLKAQRRLGQEGIPAGGTAVWRMRHRDGTWMWMESLASVIPVENGRYHILATSRDVTERMKREAELKAARDRLQQQADELTILARNLEAERLRAEQANTAKSQFLAMMSHELRTPMTGVLGMADLLLISGLSEDQERLTRLQIRSARTLLDLLNDMLDFSKIEMGQIEVEAIPFSLAEIIGEVSDLFATALADKDLQFDVSIAADVHDVVVGDPKRLRQVLSNLVNNAAKFTHRGGISVSVTMERAADAKLLLRFKVVDTGIGIKQEDIARLFRPFVQADLSTSRQYGGTGLGLAICKRLVAAMGGDISLESVPDRGSTFTFWIEVTPAVEAVPRDVARKAATTDGRSLDILIAEDNETTRYLLTTMLGRLGHRIVAVADGREAVHAVTNATFDVVLMDMQMPIMDGIEATRQIRKLPAANSAIPIIALTADALPEHHPGFIAAGANAVVVKPVAWHELGEVIDGLVPGSAVAGGMERAAAKSGTRSSASSEESRVLDDSILNELVGSLGEQAVASMMPTFVANMTEYRDRLTAAVAAGDLPAAKRVAHAMKGLTAQFGAPQVSALARYIEQDASTIAEVESSLGKLATAVTATVHAIQARSQSSEPQKAALAHQS